MLLEKEIPNHQTKAICLAVIKHDRRALLLVKKQTVEMRLLALK